MARRPTPPGFLLLGMAMALLGILSAASLLQPGRGAAGRLVLAAAATFSFVAAEALWWVRPWIGRAVDAWAAACALGLSAGLGTELGESYAWHRFLAVALLVACLALLPLLRAYVRDGAAALNALPSAGGPVPGRAP